MGWAAHNDITQPPEGLGVGGGCGVVVDPDSGVLPFGGAADWKRRGIVVAGIEQLAKSFGIRGA